MLKSGRARRAVANCLFLVVFSCSSVRIKFSCSVKLALARDGVLQKAEVQEGNSRNLPSSSRAPGEESSESFSVGY
jgi:hypothetical protein